MLLIGATRRAGTAAANALIKEGFTVIGSDDRKFPFNIHSKHTKPYYKTARFDCGRFYEDVLALIKKEKPDAVLPLLGSNQISLHKEEIKRYTNVLIPAYESFSTAFSKKRMYRVCRESGIAVPTRFNECDAELILSKNKSSVLVIKPDYDEGGARGLKYVRTPSELDTAKKEIQKRFGDYVIEEFIPGALNMRAVHLLFDKENKIAAYFILKKIHQWPVTGGVTVSAESTNETELLEFLLPFFKKYPWEGPAEAEIIIDERDGKPKLIEINPRFPGSLLFPIKCGVNFPYIACMLAADKKFPVFPPRYLTGIFYINRTFYIRSILKEFYRAKNKTVFLKKVFKELTRKKITTFPEKEDLLLYLAGTYLIFKSRLNFFLAKFK
ncbi:MAG TPA: ATP-grasp domain-containing protein [Ignavibacteriaceae bacterium]|nr:ATP-grasp domain-containing protein [Ignavibacteriaceae bacterium]